MSRTATSWPGSATSCIAIGDPSIEELFTLVADTGFQSVKVIIAPNDLRVRRARLEPSMPS